MPNKYGNISEIAQYNRENGTNFYTMEQVNKHRKESNPGFIKKLGNISVQVPVTPGSSTSAATSLQNIPKVESTVGQELGYAAGLLTTPMLLGEIGTYGPIAGGLRLAAGSAGATGGSYIAGKVGDVADKALNTNFIGDTGRILGGFAGFGAGMKATTPLLQRAATRNIRLAIPKETFTNLTPKTSFKRNPLFEQSTRTYEDSKFGQYNSINDELYSSAKNKGNYLDRTYDGRYALNINDSFERRNATGLARVKYMQEHPVKSLKAPVQVSKDEYRLFDGSTLDEELEAANRSFAKKYASDFNKNWDVGVKYNAKLNPGDIGETEGVILGRGFDYELKPIKLVFKKEDTSPLARITASHEAGHGTGNYNDSYIYNHLLENDIINWDNVSPYFKDADKGEIGQHLAEIPDYLGYKWDPTKNTYIDPFNNPRKINATQISNYMHFLIKNGFPQNKTILGNIKNMPKFVSFINEHPFAIAAPTVGVGLAATKNKEEN